MKRLFVCLLLVGVVGCGESEPAKETLSNEIASPNKLAEQPSGNPLSGSATVKPRSAEDVARALKDIALAFRNRAGVHRGRSGHNPAWFDKDGRPYLSWRVFLLPFVAGERSLFREFQLEEPWDSPHNKPLLDRMPEIYKAVGVTRSGYTSMLTFTGPSTPFDYTRRRTGGMWQLLSPYSGPIPDGQDKTILVIQAGADKAVPWTKPDDLTPDFDKPWKCLGKVGDHVHVVFIDGSVLRLPTTLNDANLRDLITPAGGEPENGQTPEAQSGESQEEIVAALKKHGAGIGTDGSGNIIRLAGDNTQITDADLARVATFTSLGSLTLSNSRISDAGLEHLTRLTNLTILVLNQNTISDAGLEHLKGIANLEMLFLGSTKISDAGLVHLVDLKKLESLFLGNTEISDVGLVHLAGLMSLRSLRLPRTTISDSGLTHLRGLTNLERLSLEGTQVTDAGVAELQKALPRCKIKH